MKKNKATKAEQAFCVVILKSRTPDTGGKISKKAGKGVMEGMTAGEVLRLWEYLTAKGWTADEIIALVSAIANR